MDYIITLPNMLAMSSFFRSVAVQHFPAFRCDFMCHSHIKCTTVLQGTIATQAIYEWFPTADLCALTELSPIHCRSQLRIPSRWTNIALPLYVLGKIVTDFGDPVNSLPPLCETGILLTFLLAGHAC